MQPRPRRSPKNSFTFGAHAYLGASPASQFWITTISDFSLDVTNAGTNPKSPGGPRLNSASGYHGDRMQTGDLDWQYLDFSQLTLSGLYEIMALRQLVFVVEQKCVFLDADGYDLSARHLIGRRDGKLLAYARVLPPGVKYAEYSIGRVVVDPGARKLGFGRAAMLGAMRRIVMADGPVPIRIQAQEHLADTLYKPLGFERITGVYDEDGIPHVDMRFTATRE
jgi:ElaA protein